MNDELPKTYQPAEVEPRWYSRWESAGLFVAHANAGKKPFTIVIPPPNITGSLHMGHALNNTIQDILTRTRRMQGWEALWIPGTDHAGIATQAVVERDLQKEGKTRHDLGRAAFLERVWQWRDQYGRTIVSQLKRLGASCDWTRERFTMDAQCSRAVRVAFEHFYRKGWIYRGKRIVNWCPQCLTALSDLEVEHEEDPNGRLYHLRYPVEGSADAIVIATTRPETILADSAIAVHPDDPRYAAVVGKNALLPLVGRRLPIIPDSHVEKDFGSGALKVTPAHDANDFEIGQRHHLDTYVGMDEHGVMNDLVPAYQGLDRFACRKQILRDLEEAGALVKEEPYVVSLAKCYRCDTVLEPYLSDQWFVRMDELGKPALDVVKEGRIRFFPERYTRLYVNWMENLRDWCVSRQLWWGHRVPVWTCAACGHQDSHVEDPTTCPQCGSAVYQQETDVLDTWFSSALWPLSTLGWPDDTEDLRFFYPTSVLSTARDILYLWVARMIMMGLEFKHEVPYHDVYVHATILAADGQRMSKSKGNGVDPVDLFDKYGTDATRFGLAWMTGQGQDARFAEDRISMSRNFANKIWNAARLAMRFLAPHGFQGVPGHREEWRLEDAWILSRLQRLIQNVTRAVDDYAFDAVAKELYEFFWDEFCDWYLELVKPAFYERDVEHEKEKAGQILDYVLSAFLKLLHPVMPFITEEIWQQLPAFADDRGPASPSPTSRRGWLMTAPWPRPDPHLIDERAERHFQLVMDTVRGLRNMRAEVNVAPKDVTAAILVFADDEARQALLGNVDALRRLAGCDPVTVVDVLDQKPPAALSVRVAGGELFLPLEGQVDFGKEVERLTRELADIEANRERTEAKLAKPGFVERARPDVVQRERDRLRSLEDNKTRVVHRLELLRGLAGSGR